MKNKVFVFDTNTLVSAFLQRHSVPRNAYNRAVGSGILATSANTFAEFSEVFLRRKFDKYVTIEDRLSVVRELKTIVIEYEVTETITACRDPKDDKFLALAVAANVACIITGDEDLLVLHPFRNIPILNASDFMTQPESFFL